MKSDEFTTENLMDAVKKLRENNIEPGPDGYYVLPPGSDQLEASDLWFDGFDDWDRRFDAWMTSKVWEDIRVAREQGHDLSYHYELLPWFCMQPWFQRMLVYSDVGPSGAFTFGGVTVRFDPVP